MRRSAPGFGLLLAVFLSGSASLLSSDLAEAVNAYFSTPPARDFSGTVLIAERDQIRVLQSYGLAERNLGMANQPDMLYRIGSLTKPFTATAVLTLVQSGKIHLQDRIAEHIRGCPALWQDVTIENLLDHTSGIQDLFGEMRAVPLGDTQKEAARVMESSAHLALISKPGATYRYSNFNYMLLGIMIEDITGLGWEEYLRRYVIAPAGLKHTLYDDAWTVIPGRVSGYLLKEKQFRPIAYKDDAAYSAGGLLSSARDLLSFARALFEHRLVNAELLAEMTRPRLGNYGLGLQIIELNGRLAYNHTGGTNGFASHLQYYPREQLTVVVLSNTEDEPVKKIATDLASLALRP